MIFECKDGSWPPSGTAGFVRASGSLWSNQSGEGDIRKNIIEADKLVARVQRAPADYLRCG